MKRSMIARREATREKLPPYIERRVLPALGQRGAEYRLQIPNDGTRSIVLFLETARARYVIKCYDDFLRAARTAATMRHMERRGAPTPKLLLADLGLWTRVRLGSAVLVEEAISGQNLYEVTPTPERLQAAARTLARMHAITRDTYGGLFPGGGRRGNYFDVIQARLRRRAKHLAGQTPEFAPIAELVGWLGEQRSVGVMQPSYSLCHLRVTDTNVLFDGDGVAWLIDVVTARYGLMAIDMERALHRWCEDDPALSEAFLGAYFSSQDLVTRERWEQHRPYFHAAFHLTQAYRAGKTLARVVRAGKGASRRAQRGRRRLRHHLSGLQGAFGGVDNPPHVAVPGVLQDCVHRYLEILDRSLDLDEGDASEYHGPPASPATENT